MIDFDGDTQGHLVEKFNQIKADKSIPTDQQFLQMLEIVATVLAEFEQSVDNWSEALKAAHSKGFAEGVEEASALFTTGGQTTEPHNRWRRGQRDSDSSDYLYVLG